MSSSEHSFAHCRDRAHQRYGLTLNQFDYRWLCGQIERAVSANAKLLVRQARGHSIWLLRVTGKWCVVVWSDHKKQLITFLPRGTQFDDDTGLPILTHYATRLTDE